MRTRVEVRSLRAHRLDGVFRRKRSFVNRLRITVNRFFAIVFGTDDRANAALGIEKRL